MSYNITQLKSDLQSILASTDLTKISSPDPLIERAARDVLADVDMYELVKDEQIATPIYKDAYYYAAPADLKGDGVIDIYQQGNRPDDVTYFRLKTAFDARRYKDDETFTVEKLNGNLYLRINKILKEYGTIDSANDVTKYSAGSNVSNVVADTVQYIEGGSSVKFDLDQTGSSSTAVINIAPTSLNLSSYDPDGEVFMWVYFPDASKITSVQLKLGNDSSNYWAHTVTSAHAGIAFSSGWNLLKFDPFNQSETGTIDNTVVDYASISIVYDGTGQEGVRVDYITVALGKLFRVKYYSKYMFQNHSSGAWSDTITTDNDTVNLDNDSYNLLLYKAASYFIQSQHDFNYKPNDSEADRFELQYQQYLRQYRKRYKSERMRQQVIYYPY